MANPVPILENPIVVAVIDNLQGRLDDVVAIQRLLDLVRAEIAGNAALYAEAAAQLAQARRSLAEAMVAAAARGTLADSEEGEEEELVDPDDPELVALAEAIFDADARRAPPESEEEEPEPDDPMLEARAVAYAELADRVVQILRLDRILAQALAFVVVVRAAAFAWTRAPLLPGVLLTAAAAYALLYAASGGAVVPGSASLMRISVLLLCFLLGFWD